MSAAKPTNRSSEELAMRELLVPELRKRWPGARIIQELPLRYSTCRIDMAAVLPDEIVSVEIKSSRDVIDRLERQIRSFAPISARVIVALAPTHNADLGKVERKVRGGTLIEPVLTPAQQVIERVDIAHVEAWTVDVDAKRVDAKDHWPGYRGNELPWLAQMLDMLHVAELERIASQHRVAVGKRPNHTFLVRQCHTLMTGREITRAVCHALRTRNAFAAGTDAPIIDAARAA